MRTGPMFARALFACLYLVCVSPIAWAADLNGAWANDAAACPNIFVKKGSAISIANKADLYGSGFIIEGNRIRGKMATCNIKARKDEETTVHLVATCSTDIALETVQFTLKIIDQNKIARVFPGMPELETSYVRCAL